MYDVSYYKKYTIFKLDVLKKENKKNTLYRVFKSLFKQQLLDYHRWMERIGTYRQMTCTCYIFQVLS